MQPPQIEALSADLRAAFQLAWDELKAEELAIASEPTKWRRRARIRELQTMVLDRMDRLDALAEQWFSNDFAVAWQLGGQASAAVLGAEYAWTQVDLQAVTQLAQSGFNDLLRATQYVRDDVKRLVRALSKEATLVGRIKGETSTTTARRLTRALQQHGLKAVQYANGSKHGIAEWAETVVRTTTGTAYNIGQLTTAQRFGVQYVEVFDGTQDLVCAAVANSIQTVEWAMANPLGHPRCQRGFGPRPELTTAEDAARAQPSTTPAQRADQQASEERRAAARASR